MIEFKAFLAGRTTMQWLAAMVWVIGVATILAMDSYSGRPWSGVGWGLFYMGIFVISAWVGWRRGR